MAYDHDDLSERIAQLKPMPGLPERPKKLGLGFTANPAGNGGRDATVRALTEEIHEGGTDRTRWDEFSRVAGAFIRSARHGAIPDIDAARDMTLGWMHAKMKPAWPEDRFHKEFNALLARDLSEKGPLPKVIDAQQAPDGWSMAPLPFATRETNLAHLSIEGLKSAMGQHWAEGEVRKRRWIVEGLILAAKPHLFVAEGGAGKTTMMLDLALKVARGEGIWMGRPINPDEAGVVVLVTGEDDADELRAKLRQLCTPEEIRRAGENLVILPLINIGGTFALVQTRRRRVGNDLLEEHGPSEQWETLMQAMHALSRERPIKAVIVDTLNATLHGEENSATVIQEYMRQACRVCGELAAALIVLHHVRKRGRDPIWSKFDMADAVRGSSALLGSVRMAIGIWPCPDYEKRMLAMNESPRPGMLFFGAVIKANNSEAMPDTLTLLRSARGELVDVSKRDKIMLAKSKDHRAELRAWLVAAVRRAVEEGHPFQTTSTTMGLLARLQQLPKPLHVLNSKTALPRLADELVEAGLLVRAKIDGAGKAGHCWLDVPNGYAAKPDRGLPPCGTFMLKEGDYAPDWSGWFYDEQMLIVRER